MFPLMKLQEILPYEPDMKKLGVSIVARSPRGFLTAYKRGQLTDDWLRKRDAFIKRHMAQYRKNPTVRRHLALIAWAYDPSK